MTAVDSAKDEGWFDGGRPYNRMRRRRIILAVIVLIVVIAVVGAVLLALRIKSPAQQAAQTRAPALTQLTAQVQQTVLASTVLAQGVVKPPAEFSPSIIGGSAGAAAGQDVQQIVTRVFHRAGGYIGQGQVIMEIAGQPFFLLQGGEPAYRNLVPGETGPDVAQLQDDLEALGYGVGADASGVYGPGTSAGVTDFYDAIGYPAPQVSTGPKADRGAMVPLGEFSFVSRLPAKIVSLGATVGQPVKAGALTLADGNPVIDGQLSPSEARMVRPGMRVSITEPGTGAVVSGWVTSVSTATASTASISGGLYVAMGIRASRPLPLSLVSQDVSITITAAHSSGRVLAVPEAAVFAGANGQTYVSRLVHGRLVRVPVRVGMSGSGLVQVTPLRAGSLTSADQVATGENYAGASPVRPAFARTGPGGNPVVRVIGPSGGNG